jgi:hypothetical protein
MMTFVVGCGAIRSMSNTIERRGNMQNVVLLVEEEDAIRNGWRWMLEHCSVEGGIHVLDVGDLPRFYEVFEEQKAVIALIAWDGLIRGDVSHAVAIQWARAAGFTGPMLACSSSPDIREKQMTAGCSHEVEKKTDVPKVAIGLLGKTYVPSS